MRKRKKRWDSNELMLNVWALQNWKHNQLYISVEVKEICEGGPVITDTGVVGLNFFGNSVFSHPLPTQVILSCLEMMRKSSGNVLRPWFGISVVDRSSILSDINLSHETPHVVVKEVHEGTVADKNNVRPYDSIASLNGAAIQSAKQYSELLFELVTDHIFGKREPFMVSNKVGIHSFDGRDIIIEGEYILVDDRRLHDCIPKYCWRCGKLRLVLVIWVSV